MRIGIDFDNTIVCYDKAFYLAALEKKLIPEHIPQTKSGVRNFLRANSQEDLWTELQGYIYGKRMDLSHPFEDIDIFLDYTHKNKIETFIISHKTLYPYLGPKYNLHDEAKRWIDSFTFLKKVNGVFFELTLQEKLSRIENQKCDYYIDDLPELLNHPNFPKNTRKILFDSNNLYILEPEYKKFSSWDEILDFIKNL